MSLAGLFKNIAVTKIVDDKTAEEIGRIVESSDYHKADIIDEKRYVPLIDFSEPKNFAKYGSAEKYYEDSFTYVSSLYPYDGSLAEKLQWKNSGSYLDIYIFDREYPRTNGYINLSYDTWGTPAYVPTLAAYDGYGIPNASTDYEYISVDGGPGLGGGPQAQSANIYDPANNRESNLEFDLTKGVTVECWLKKSAFNTSNTEKEVLIDLWNNELSSSNSYGRFRLELTGTTASPAWTATVLSGSDPTVNGFQWQTFGTGSSSDIADDLWHHYAFSFLSASAGVTAKYYIDGSLQTTENLGTVGINKITGSMQAYIGALITKPSGSTAPSSAIAKSGKMSASLDEFRYWKTQRSSEKIGKYWFTQVGGGTNTDLANTDLGVYYKFNEGITTTASVDSVVLDYSGRVSNGTWTGYSSGARNTGSAIVEASASATEFKDPIIYEAHPDVQSKLATLKLTGSVHDNDNSSLLFSYFPSWMQSRDVEDGSELKKLTQIMSSYFDTLYLQVEDFANIKNIRYVTGSVLKENTLGSRLLASKGLLAPELFLDADILEQLGDRSLEREYRDSLANIKNSIYQNIYNNLSNIYKSKGTRQSFRNLLRCFGVDEKIFKLNVYGNNVQYDIRNNRELYSSKKRYVDFSVNARFDATLFQQTSSLDSNTVGFITGSSQLTGGFATTLETYVQFPHKPDPFEKKYSDYEFNYLTSSLFGVHTVDQAHPELLSWNSPDNTNFQVYAIRDEMNSTDACFILSSSAGGLIPTLSSSYYDDVYSNTNWVFAVTVKPEKYPLVNYITGSHEDIDNNEFYIVEFKGTQVEAGLEVNSFFVSASVNCSLVQGDGPGFVTGSKRAYVGAHRQNFTGSVLHKSDVRVGFCRYWLDDIVPSQLVAHGMDIHNYGTENPSRSPYLFQNNLEFNIDFVEEDTLALNWDFETLTGSNSTGTFTTIDFSSGSTIMQSEQFGILGDILGAQHSGYGYGFPVNTTSSISVDYVLASEIQDFEKLNASDMISVLNTQDDIQFTRESRPINYLFAIEKSMNQTISENMIKMFSVINDFNNIVGEPVNKYRDNYKQLRVLRQKFFDRVGNTPDLDKYVEYYKWFDSALSKLIEQLIPASAEFSKDVRTVVESHILERNKYQFRFPTMDLKGGEYSGDVRSPLPLSPGWQFTHHPVNDQQDTNSNYWKTLASRDKGLLKTDDNLLNANKQITFDNTAASTRARKEKNIYRFVTTKSRVIKAGNNYSPRKVQNYVFPATAPWGPNILHSNVPENIMLSFASDVEDFKDTVDVLNPSEKKRMKFGIDPTINKSVNVSDKADGNTLAPFSLYSSSTATGYNAEVSTYYSASVELTNLHEDIVGNSDTRPLQGPFTEKFVGGRFYRHTELNDGNDTRFTRAEGFRLQLGGLALDGYPGALGIVPPNYPFLDSPPGSAPEGFLPELKTAHRLRDENSKRPVNIKNILMTTASADTRLSGTILHSKIGNYSKNYQVVQTAGRTINDPFFQDQSFDFALNPQSPYPRLPTVDRHPAQNIRVRNTTAISIDTTSNTFRFDADAVPAMNTNKQETWSFWLNCTNPGSVQFFIVGDNSDDRVMGLTAANKLIFQAYFTGDNGQWTTDLAVTTGNEWIHVAVVYDGSSDANDPQMFVNGAEVALDPVATIRPTNTLNDYTGWISLGQANLTRFTGYISDIAFYNKTLTNKEIAAVYGNSTLDLKNYGPPRVESNLLLWYRCGNGPGDSTSAIIDQMGNTNLVAVNSPSLIDISPGDCLVTANDNNFALPDRSGANSNKTVFVNRFSAPGSYEALSRGYLDPAHEEKSVYNVLPYRNLSVLNYGTEASTSADPTIANAIVVNDSVVSRARGLRQRQTVHNAQFGYDGVYTDSPAAYKVNRNRKLRVEDHYNSSFVTASVYDNWFSHRPIPRSEQQYSWITASMDPEKIIYGYSELSGGYFVQSLPLISSSYLLDATTPGLTVGVADFVGMNRFVFEPLTGSTNTLGYPVSAPLSSYRNTFKLQPGSISTPDIFNTVLLSRNGPYGWPTWKQIRVGENPVRRYHERNSILSVRTKTATDTRVGSQKGNTITQFTEPQVYSSEIPIVHKMTTGIPGTTVTVPSVFKSSFGNKLIHLANYEANNLLNITKDYQSSDLYFNRINSMILKDQNNDATVAGSLSQISAIYAQTVYPAGYNANLNRTRARENYTIADIWDNTRTSRSTYSGTTNSQGTTIVSASIWPLDGHNHYETTSSVGQTGSAGALIYDSDGAGELQNGYSRYFQSGSGGTMNYLAPAATYASRLPLGSTGSFDVFGGDVVWQAGAQSGLGLVPYKTYEQYAEYLRLVGKDYSIVPEFRISNHVGSYILNNNPTSLTSSVGLFDLTGSAYENSSETGFYKTYANSDFMKMFEVVEEAYEGQELVDGSKMSMDTIALRCSALCKFLPYKGFYPAERTLELATLLSQSYGDSLVLNSLSASSATGPINGDTAVYRALLEPLFAPGIMYNTIKSGLAVSNFVVTCTASAPLEPSSPPSTGKPASVSASFMGGSHSTVVDNLPNPTALPEGDVWFEQMLYFPVDVLNDGPRGTPGTTIAQGASTNGFIYQKVPFEAIKTPSNYLSNRNLRTELGGSGRIYDNGLGSASLEDYNESKFNYVEFSGAGDKRYEFAVDNFLCETVNFFENGLTSISSKREDEFKEVLSGSTYSMSLTLHRPISGPSDLSGTSNSAMQHPPNLTGPANRDAFEMYRRVSAFGPPLASIDIEDPGSGEFSASYSHLTPAYFAGTGSAHLAFTAPYDGIPALADIFANTIVTYTRHETTPLYIKNNGSGENQSAPTEFRVNVDDSFDLFGSVDIVSEGTTAGVKRWLLQSKFETPILNFANSTSSIYPPSTDPRYVGGTAVATTDAGGLTGSGMWHTFGELATGSNGVFATVTAPRRNSLADIVGIPVGSPQRIGEIKQRGQLQEAVVAVPFVMGEDGRRKFYKLQADDLDAKKSIMGHLGKYVFPPRFDFMRYKEMDPVAMYVFEFGVNITQEDLARMWQNLPPSVGETFTKKEATVEHKLLKEHMLNKTNRKITEDLRWLVFKVKIRAQQGYDRFKVKNLASDPDGIPSYIGDAPYSYNWPYDYFSLVELVKIDEALGFESTAPPDSTTQIIGTVNVDIPNPIITTPLSDT